jgi:hypothetical protein
MKSIPDGRATGWRREIRSLPLSGHGRLRVRLRRVLVLLSSLRFVRIGGCVLPPPIGTGSRSKSGQLLATAPSRATPSNDQVVIFAGGVGGDDRMP